MRWFVVVTIVILAVLWGLLQTELLPPGVADIVAPIVGLACSLAVPALLISFYLVPGWYQNLSEDVRQFWERIRQRRNEVDDLRRKIVHLDKPYHMLQLGSLLAAQGKSREAAELFEKAVERDASLLDARYRLALCRFEAGSYEDAAGLLEQVHETKPDHAYGMAYLRLAEAHHRAGNGERASEVYEILLRFYPSHPEGAYNYALLLSGNGGVERARDLMREVVFAVRLSPRFHRRRNRHWALKARWWLLRN